MKIMMSLLRYYVSQYKVNHEIVSLVNSDFMYAMSSKYIFLSTFIVLIFLRKLFELVLGTLMKFSYFMDKINCLGFWSLYEFVLQIKKKLV